MHIHALKIKNAFFQDVMGKVENFIQIIKKQNAIQFLRWSADKKARPISERQFKKYRYHIRDAA